jgi:hypothetical protein
MPLNNMKTWVTGEVVTAGQLNSDVRDAVNSLTPGHQVVTTAQKNALTGVATGTMVYDSTIGAFQSWAGGSWVTIQATMVAPTISVSGGTAVANTSGTVSFSVASSISLNNCFTTGYDIYQVFARWTNASGNTSIALLIRAAETNLASYIGERTLFSGANAPSSNVHSTSQAFVGFNNTAPSYGFANFFIQSPMTSQPTMVEGRSYGGANLHTIAVTGTTSTTQHDGLSFTANGTGTITGDIRVVGIA